MDVEEKNECIVCGASGKTYAMYFCDQSADGPWCAEHFVAATGCTEEAHGEGCLTAVFEKASPLRGLTADQAATLRLRAEQLAQAALSLREVAAQHRQEIAALRAHCVRQNRALRDMQRSLRLLQRPPRYARVKAWIQAGLADMGFGFKSETHTGASRPYPEGAL